MCVNVCVRVQRESLEREGPKDGEAKLQAQVSQLVRQGHGWSHRLARMHEERDKALVDMARLEEVAPLARASQGGGLTKHNKYMVPALPCTPPHPDPPGRPPSTPSFLSFLLAGVLSSLIWGQKLLASARSVSPVIARGMSEWQPGKVQRNLFAVSARETR